MFYSSAPLNADIFLHVDIWFDVITETRAGKGTSKCGCLFDFLAVRS